MTSLASAATSSTSEFSRAFKASVAAGSVSATVDLIYISTFSYLMAGVMPARILKSIATGLLGPDAFNGGAGVAALGFVCHYAILIVAAALFWVAARRIPFLTQRALLAGVLYGLAIWLVMNYIVLPLSAAPKFNGSMLGKVCNFAAHLVLIGPSLALTIKRFATKP